MTDDQAKQIHDMHAAFFDIPAGSPKGTLSLIEEIRAVTKAYRMASWFTRALIWGMPTVAMLGASGVAIAKWFKGG